MDFNLSDEQRMLKDSVDRFVKDQYTFADRSALIYSQRGYSEKNWQLFAEMGWLGLPFEERFGGFDGSAVDTAIVMEAFGRGLVLEPFVSTVILGGGLVAAHAHEEQKEALIPQIIEGALTLAFAYLEPQSGFDPANIETKITKTEDKFVLNGQKSVVYQGGSADYIIVSARSEERGEGDAGEKTGISLLIMDQSSPGVTRKDYKTLDGQWASDFTFNNVALDESALLGEAGAALPAIEMTLGRVISAHCAEAVGAMAEATEITKAYIQTREQFGVTISSFQVLQHRLVDMFMEAELAKSMSDVLAMRLRDKDDDSDQMLAATKVKIGKAGTAVGQGATQLHGGIGMTNECSIGHYYKRLMMIDILFGTQDYHSCRYEQLQALAS